MASGNIIVPYASIQEAFQTDPSRINESVYDGANEVAAGDSVQRARLIAAWNNALGALENNDKGTVLSSPQNALASRLQTLLAQSAAATGKLRAVQRSEVIRTNAGETISPEVLEVKFDNADLVGWLGMAWKLIFKPMKHQWITPPHTPEPIPDDANLAIFGDWGTALYGAPAIAKSISAMNRCDVALHLGDTYYSGSEEEVRDRLIGDWPKRNDQTINRSLNGNHEMYSGGKGYFEALATFFKQPASCFAMQNSNWLLVCMDTAYEDFNIAQSQIDWLMATVSSAKAKRLILFSHHQPFSQLDAQGPNLQAALSELLNKQRIHAWFWGHEHRLVLYEAHSIWGFKGRCVGHGGFPAFRDSVQGSGGSLYHWIDLPSKPYVPAARLLDGPNLWIASDQQRYSPHGYVTLEFEGERAWETYRTPDGAAVSDRLQL
jgi:hypothetical protein